MFSKSQIQDLIINAQGGDRPSCEMLLENFSQLVKTIARRYFLMDGDFDDLIQKGLIGLYSAIMKYDESKNAEFEAFSAICINRSIQTAVKQSRRDKHKPISESVDFDQSAEAAQSFASMSAEDEYFEKEQRKGLSEAIKKLKPQDRQILAMFLDGETYATIASVLSLTNKFVDNRLQSIKRTLRKLVG